MTRSTKGFAASYRCIGRLGGIQAGQIGIQLGNQRDHVWLVWGFKGDLHREWRDNVWLSTGFSQSSERSERFEPVVRLGDYVVLQLIS